jgi:hypothetical protein
MKTRYLKMNWLIPVLGIAVVGGGLVAGTIYLDLERQLHAEQAFTATLDRLFQDQQISAALKRIHDGEAEGAAQRLDMLLCGNILRTDAELASADARTRAYMQLTFRRIARLRPKTADGAVTGSTHECDGDRAAAQRILELALAGDPGARTK